MTYKLKVSFARIFFSFFQKAKQNFKNKYLLTELVLSLRMRTSKIQAV